MFNTILYIYVVFVYSIFVLLFVFLQPQGASGSVVQVERGGWQPCRAQLRCAAEIEDVHLLNKSEVNRGRRMKVWYLIVLAYLT